MKTVRNSQVRNSSLRRWRFSYLVLLTPPKKWAMPLWQSMQVLLALGERGRVRVGGALALAREVHGLELVAVAALERVVGLHARPLAPASSCRLSRNFSRVLMVPKIQPHTSFEACILRAIL